MLSLPIYLRGSSYYLHTRVAGKQLKKSLYTADKQLAIIKASEILKSLRLAMDLSKLQKYELDLDKGILKADSPEDHQRLLEAMQVMAVLKQSKVGPAETALEALKTTQSIPTVQPHQKNGSNELEQGLTLLEVLDKMLLLKKYAQATVIAYTTAVEEFQEFLGKKKLIGSILKSDISRYQEHLINKGNTHRTVDNKVNNLRAVFFFAIKQGYFFGENPASNRDLTSKKDKLNSGYNHFEPEEIKAIFQSKFFTDCKSKDKDYYWTVALGLFTGARISEITSLTVEQFKKTSKGHWFIKIEDAKTYAGKREIPIPEFLMDGGLKEILETAKSGQIFKYKLRYGKGSGNAVGKKFKRHLEELKITRPKLVFHSIRKFFNTELAASQIPIEVRCQLVGHELENVNVQVYLNPLSIEQMAEVIQPVQKSIYSKYFMIKKL